MQQLQTSRVPLFLLALLAIVCLPSCRTHFEFDFKGDGSARFVDSLGPQLLAARATDDGSTTKYSVSGQTRRFPYGKRGREGAILTATKATLEVPFLGLDVTSVDAATAEGLGLEAWRGVLIAKVEPDSAASTADLRRADLLLSVNGVALSSQAQFADFVSGSLLPGDTIEFEVSRPRAEFLREDLVVSAVVGGRTIEETAADRVDLPLDDALVQHAGIGVLTVPADLAEEIYGSREPAAVIAAVMTGSPAYLAGFRAGDRVVRANGVPVSTAEELSEVAERGADRLELEVEALLGAHSAGFNLHEDLTDESDFSIPILVDYESRADRTSLSVLDFIFQFGFNRRSHYLLSSNRAPRKSSFLSILPLGMFEFERTPTRSTNRLFWLIRWSSKR